MPLKGIAAQDYPARPITLVAPYPPGGGVDVTAPLVGQRLSTALRRQVVIENRGGAGGMIGTRDLARAAPDGYTLGMMLPASVSAPTPAMMSTRIFPRSGSWLRPPSSSSPIRCGRQRSLADVIALAKQKPGKLSAGTPPAPTINYFAGRQFNLTAGADIAVVTYKGLRRAPTTCSAITCRSASIRSRRR